MSDNQLPKLRSRAAAVLAACACILSAGIASGAGRVTDKIVFPFDFITFVPCANDGAGELVSFSGVWHIVNEPEPFPDLIEHGNWSNAKGTGQITNDRYIITQTSNAVPFADGGFLVNLRVIGTGRGAAKFSVTQLLKLDFPAPPEIEDIRVTCR